MPLRTRETSGWSQSHWSAHSAGVQSLCASSNTACASAGGCARVPPSSGSMIATGSPAAVAYLRPSVPAWFSMSM